MTPDDTKLDVPLGLGNSLHHQTVNNQSIPSFKGKKRVNEKEKHMVEHCDTTWSPLNPPSPALCTYGVFGPDAQAQLRCLARDH